MRYLAYWLLPAFAAALALGGCGTLERQPEPVSPGGVPKTAATGARVEPSHKVRPADRAADGATEGAPAGSPREFQPADRVSNFNLHIYGFSYHPDREGVRRNKLDNESNWGLGLNYVLHEDARGVRFVEAGIYKDSGYNWAKLLGLGYQFKLGERWRLGGGLVGVQSPTYNRGKFFIAPLPIVTYDFGHVELNAIYAPRYGEYNQFEVFGFYVSIPFGRLGK